MDAQTSVEFLHLHCEHLRSLVEQLITDFTRMQHALAADDPASYTLVAPHVSGVYARSAHLAAEVARLQAGVSALAEKSEEALRDSNERLPQRKPAHGA